MLVGKYMRGEPYFKMELTPWQVTCRPRRLLIKIFLLGEVFNSSQPLQSHADGLRAGIPVCPAIACRGAAIATLQSIDLGLEG